MGTSLELDACGEQRGSTGVAELPGDAAALSQQPDTAALAQGIPCRVLALFISSCTHQTIMFKKQHSYKTPAVCFFQCHSGLLIV